MYSTTSMKQKSYCNRRSFSLCDGLSPSRESSLVSALVVAVFKGPGAEGSGGVTEDNGV